MSQNARIRKKSNKSLRLLEYKVLLYLKIIRQRKYSNVEFIFHKF